MNKFLILMLIVSISAYSQLSGTKTVGVGGDYTTIASAISALNSNGVNGALIFSLTDATYAETGSNLVVTVTTNAPTAVNTVTFKPASGVTTAITITGCATSTASGTQPDTAKRNSGFTINYTNYVTIDGSNNGSSSRNMSFIMNDATNGRNAITMFGNCDNVTIKNIIVTYSAIGSTTVGNGIFVNGQSSGAALGAADNFTAQNNLVGTDSDTRVGPHIGISYTGASTASVNCTGGNIVGNEIHSRIRGINLFWSNGSSSTLNVENNSISIANAADAQTCWGILQQQYTGTTNIHRNKIHKTRHTSTGTQGHYLIGTLSNQASAVLNIYNNFLGGDLSRSGTGTPASIDLISLQDNIPTANISHNTLVYNNLTATATTRMSGIRFGGTSSVNIKNNIIVMSKDATTAYCIRNDGGTLASSNYNNLYVSSANGRVGYSSSTARVTLSDWQSATSLDGNSKSVSVTFDGATDFHLGVGSEGDANLVGVTGLGISTDIDNESRSGSFPYMGADEGETLLPVELTTFTAVAKGKNVELKWSTATETNNHGFEIERSVNGTWSKIGFVQGAGNSNSPKEYGYVDAVNEGGRYSYRLKQIDNDGRISYHTAIEVNIVTAELSSYELAQNFPNPFNPVTTIRFSVKQMEQASVKVYDITGKEVAELFNGIASPGQIYNVQFNGSGLASGMYLYVLQTPSAREVRKMSMIK